MCSLDFGEIACNKCPVLLFIIIIYVAYFFLNPYCLSDIILCFVKKAVEPIVHNTFDYF